MSVEYEKHCIARPTCILIKLYRVAPQSGTDPVWVLIAFRYRNNLNSFVKGATLWLGLLGTWWGIGRWYCVLIGICSCTSLLETLQTFHTFLFIMSIVLELRRISRDLLKISCRDAWIGSAIGTFTFLLAEIVRISASYADSPEELISNLWVCLFVLRGDGRPKDLRRHLESTCVWSRTWEYGHKTTVCSAWEVGWRRIIIWC